MGGDHGRQVGRQATFNALEEGGGCALSKFPKMCVSFSRVITGDVA